MNSKLINKMVEIQRRRAKRKGLDPLQELVKAIQVVYNEDKWDALEKEAKKELSKKP
jgi:hypothetical protein